MAKITLPGAVAGSPGRSQVTAFPNGGVAFSVAAADAEFDNPVTIIPGSPGTIVITPWNGGSDLTFTRATDGSAPPPGTPVDIRARAVKMASTATGLIAAYE